MREFYKIATIAVSQPQRWYGIVLGGLLVAVSFFFRHADLSNGMTAALDFSALLTMFFLVFVGELFPCKKARPLLNIGTTLLGADIRSRPGHHSDVHRNLFPVAAV